MSRFAAITTVGMAMRAADRCYGCGHRRDVHVSGDGECCHVKASALTVGGPYRCACSRFAATAAGARRRRVAR